MEVTARAREQVRARPEPGRCCEEASPMSREVYIACGKPATCLISLRDEGPYAMCEPCADHNVRNRGGHYLMTDAPEPADAPAEPPQPSASALATVTTLLPANVFAPGGINTLLSKLEAEVRLQARSLADISSPKNRKAIASLAYKVARSKTALDDMGKELGADWKRKAGLVDADRRTLRERLDALQSEVRAPLDRYEAEEAQRIADHETAIAAIAALADTAGMTFEAINERIWSMPAASDRAWQEFRVRAEQTIAATRQTLIEALDAARLREAAEAEAEAVRQREAARIHAENEARRMEHEAQIAANARALALMEAEQAAERERQVAALAIAEADARAAAAHIAAEQAAQKAEADRLAAAAEAERQQQAAVAAERQRAAAQAAAEAAETARRERNAAHRRRINREALADMMAAMAAADADADPQDQDQALIPTARTESIARTIIAAIAKGAIRHITVSY